MLEDEGVVAQTQVKSTVCLRWTHARSEECRWAPRRDSEPTRKSDTGGTPPQVTGATCVAWLLPLWVSSMRVAELYPPTCTPAPFEERCNRLRFVNCHKVTDGLKRKCPTRSRDAERDLDEERPSYMRRRGGACTARPKEEERRRVGVDSG